MTFHEERLSTRISFGSSYVTSRKTDVVEMASGYEVRNQIWVGSKRMYDISYGIKGLNDVYLIQAFFEARGGPLFGFRFKDHLDYKSCGPMSNISNADQNIGTGNGTTTQFQVKKAYVSGGVTYSRDIKKLVVGTLVVALNGTPTTAFTVNINTGVITFNTAPSSGVPITCGYEFDTPVRFKNDDLVLSLSNFGAGSIPNIPLIEVRL